MSRAKVWLIIGSMTLGSFTGGVLLHRGKVGAVLGALAAGLVVSGLMVPARDRHQKP